MLIHPAPDRYKGDSLISLGSLLDIGSLGMTVAFGLVILIICLYGGHRYWLLWMFVRRTGIRRNPIPPGRFGELPTVTVQLPMYNEQAVAERVIEAACRLDYPHDKLKIQVLDDSTDDSADVARRCCERMREEGYPVEYIHRSHREGYKAGALAAGLAADESEFVAVFDSDFVPPRDFLRAAIHQFTFVGDLTMIAGCAKIVKDIPPFTVGDGNPARICGLNVVGLRRMGYPVAMRKAIKSAYKTIYHSAMNVEQALTQLRHSELIPEVSRIISFFERSERGVTAHR